MWRLFAWRLELEFWNFLAFLLQFPLFRRLQHFDRPVGYFAFGANLDPSVLARRGMRVLDEKELLLRDHVLLFNQPGPFEGFGFASVEAAPGRMVYGKVLTISRIDAIRMDFYEVLPYIHRHRRVWAEQDGVRVFFYQATHPQAGQIPSREYLDKILYSAERSRIIPPALLEELRNTPTLDVLIPRRSPHFLIDDYGSAPDWLVAWRKRYDMQGVRFFRFLYGLTFFSAWIRPELPPEPAGARRLTVQILDQELSNAD
jgi:hypothetical protein